MPYSKEQKEQWIIEWEQSRQSPERFCQGKPFHKSTFYNWRKKVIDAKGEIKKRRQFTPLEVLATHIPQVSIHYPNGIRVDMHMEMSVDQIRALVGC